MDILSFETRAGLKIEFSHVTVTSSTATDVLPGDHMLRIVTPSGFTQLAFTPEQWGQIADSIISTSVLKRN